MIDNKMRERQARIAEIKTVQDLAIFVQEDLHPNFTIALHNINNFTVDDPEKIARLILETGLNNSFNNFRRTAFNKGKVENITGESFRYQIESGGTRTSGDPFAKNETYYNIILAIPDKLKTKENFVPLYPQQTFQDFGQDRSLFDVIYQRGQQPIPNQFVYGYYTFNPVTNLVEFISNDGHISQMAKEDFEQYVAEQEINFKGRVGLSKIDVSTIKTIEQTTEHAPKHLAKHKTLQHGIDEYFSHVVERNNKTHFKKYGFYSPEELEQAKIKMAGVNPTGTVEKS